MRISTRDPPAPLLTTPRTSQVRPDHDCPTARLSPTSTSAFRTAIRTAGQRHHTSRISPVSHSTAMHWPTMPEALCQLRQGCEAVGLKPAKPPVDSFGKCVVQCVFAFTRPHDVAERPTRKQGLSKDYWMPDEDAKECYDCGSRFTAWRRKHHCRICGETITHLQPLLAH